MTRTDVDRVYVLGDSGLAREMAQLARVVLGATSVLLSPEEEEAILDPDAPMVLGLGHPDVRMRAYRRWQGRAGFPSLVHPSAVVDSATDVPEAAVIAAGVVASVDIRIGAGTLINWNATVGHDVALGCCCVVNPQASIAGGVTLGDAVLVGTGANILEGVTVGAHARIGAGAVVTRDVPEGATVVGIPAREVSR